MSGALLKTTCEIMFVVQRGAPAIVDKARDKARALVGDAHERIDLVRDVLDNLLEPVVPGRRYHSAAFRSGHPVRFVTEPTVRAGVQAIQAMARIGEDLATRVDGIDWRHAVRDAGAALTFANLRQVGTTVLDAAARLDPYEVTGLATSIMIDRLTLGVSAGMGGAVGEAGGRVLDALRFGKGGQRLALAVANGGQVVVTPAVQSVAPLARMIGQVAGAGTGAAYVYSQGHDDNPAITTKPERVGVAQQNRVVANPPRSRPSTPSHDKEFQSIAHEGKQLQEDIAAKRVKLVKLPGKFGMTRTKGPPGKPVHYVRVMEPSKNIGEEVLRREEATYAIDQTIGTNVVPRTGLIEVDGQLASFQAEVKGVTANDNVQRVKQVIQGWQQSLGGEYKAKAERVVVLDMTIGNPDRHMGNLVFGTTGKSVVDLGAIDHHLALPSGVYIDRFNSTAKTRHFGSPTTFIAGMHFTDFEHRLWSPMEPSTRSLIMAIDEREVDNVLAARNIPKHARWRVPERIFSMQSIAAKPTSSIFEAYRAVEKLIYQH